MNRKEQGITLIALIITIIVLLILAGVSISQLLGDNGIITKTVEASGATKSATAKEDVELAWSSVTAGYYEALYKNKTSVDEKTYFSEDAINKELNSGKISNYSGYVEKGKITFTYTLNSTNDVYEMSLNTGASSNNLKILTCNGVVVDTDDPDPTYLADVVEIGDYVDIGIDYENSTSDIDLNYDAGTTELKGWRVLSSSNGSVTLISAGAPLTYKYWGGSARTDNVAEPLNNLYTTLLHDVDESADREKESYYNYCGFTNEKTTFNMKNVFTTKYINIDKGVHTINTDDFMTLYSEITGNDEISTMNDLEYINVSTDNLKDTVIQNNKEWNNKWDDLFTIGQAYWIGGNSVGDDGGYQNIWNVSDGGIVSTTSKGHYFGVRPVITLKTGIEVVSGDGSSNNAYTIKY
jgi:hypothetical protein